MSRKSENTAKKPNGAENGQAPAGANALPLFFKSPSPLALPRHAKAGIVPTRDLSFARATNSIPVNLTEFVEVAKQYPIVFSPNDEPVPLAIVGLEQRNYFVDDKGEWKQGSYIPAYVRKYPFIFMEVPEENRFLLCVDEEAPQFRAQGGEGALPFYDGEAAGEVSQNALEFCKLFHNYLQTTRQFGLALKEAGLLAPYQSEAKLFNGRTIRLGGFHVLDENKFNELPEKTILEFHQKGWLPFAYFTLMSMSNWGRLADMAGALEK